MGKVAWEKIYSVHINEIDEQHKKLIDFTNEIYDKLDKPNFNLDEFEGIFDQLIEFANWHFGTEERYFAKFNYEEADAHIQEHNKIKDKINKLKDQFLEAGKITMIFEVLKLFDDWLFVHIMEYDQKYVKLFQEHGLK